MLEAVVSHVLVCSTSAGLGLYEYMMLTEELGAEPIWVLNNGLSHEESVPTARIAPLLADALDSIEFISGPADSRWGAVRAQMGHPDPWSLTYIGVGNEVGIQWTALPKHPPCMPSRPSHVLDTIYQPCMMSG